MFTDAVTRHWLNSNPDGLPQLKNTDSFFKLDQVNILSFSWSSAQMHTHSQKKRTMISLACDPGSRSSYPGRVIFDHTWDEIHDKVHLSTLFLKRIMDWIKAWSLEPIGPHAWLACLKTWSGATQPNNRGYIPYANFHLCELDTRWKSVENPPFMA